MTLRGRRRFQWDDAKAAINEATHSTTFETAKLAFDNMLAIDWLDESEDYGEERFCVLGMAEGRIVLVAYKMRGDAIRIISARSAEAYERRRYFKTSRHD